MQRPYDATAGRIPIDDEIFRTFCENVLKDLGQFHVNATAGSAERAAAELNLTSRSVLNCKARLQKGLRNWLGEAQLFAHEKGLLPLTDAGEVLLRYSEEVRRLTEAMLFELNRLGHSSHLRVATIHSAWYAFGEPWVTEFSKYTENAIVEPLYYERASYGSDIVDAVARGDADLGITSHRPAWEPKDPRVRRRSLPPQPFVLVIPADHPIRPTTEDVDFTPLVFGRERFVTYSESLGYYIGHLVRDFLTEAGFTKLRLIKRATVDQILGAACEMQAITILPWHAVFAGVRDGRLRAYGLKRPLPAWTWSVISNPRTTRASLVDAFAGVMNDFVRGPGTVGMPKAARKTQATR